MYVIPKDLYKHQKNPMTRVVILENQWLEAKVMEADASDDFPDFHWRDLFSFHIHSCTQQISGTATHIITEDQRLAVEKMMIIPSSAHLFLQQSGGPMLSFFRPYPSLNFDPV